MSYSERMRHAEDILRPQLTDKFLETLQLAVKTCGWMVDHTESSDFVIWCYDIAGEKEPDTEPFDYGIEKKYIALSYLGIIT